MLELVNRNRYCFGFLQRPQKRSHGNQLIHRRLSKTKSIGSRSDPKSQASRVKYGMNHIIENPFAKDPSGGWQ